MQKSLKQSDLFLLSNDNYDVLYGSVSGNGGVPPGLKMWFIIPEADFPTRLASSTPAQATGQTVLGFTAFNGTRSVGYSWGGISFSATEGYYYPPDNGMAANAAASGTQTVVSSENDAIMVTNLTTSSATSGTESLTAFFGSPLSGGFYSDPRVLFDGSHFIVAVDDINPSAATSDVRFAISTTSAPGTALASTDWSQASISTTWNGAWSDQPLMAVANGYLYVTTNEFTASGSYKGDILNVVSISAATGSATPAQTTFQLNGPSYQPAATSHPSPSVAYPQYFVDHSGGYLNYFSLNGATLATGTGASGSISGMPRGGSFSAAQYGTSYKLDAGDGRVTSAVYDAANNLLYAVFEAKPAPNQAATVELVQFKPGSSTASYLYLNNLIGTLPGLPTGYSTSGASTFNASVAVDGQGDVLVNFNASGSKMLPADVYAFWKAGTTGSAPVLSAASASVFDFQNSVAAYIDPGRDSVGRWGDYSTAIADASMPNGFWISNEYDNGTVQLGASTYSSWGTVLTHVAV